MLVSEFGRVWKRRMFSVSDGKSKVMRSSRFENVGRMSKRPNPELLEEIYYFKYLGS